MKLWGGRFTADTHPLVRDFHSSIHFDQRLYRQDIQGSLAHAKMLGEAGLLSHDEVSQIQSGLLEILKEIESGQIQFDSNAEDIHMNIERLLTLKIGNTAKKLHTARSRNDQVALDLRLYLLAEIQEVQSSLLALVKTLIALAQNHVHTLMPGYTHLQRAQPITLAHHLLAYVAMFERDYERFSEGKARTAVSPLGSGALAGTPLPINRELTAQFLNLPSVSSNTLDAVSDRDFAIEFCSHASILMMHLSRLSEELILWSSQEFKFVELDDAFSTGSSMMPQKKNPDIPELVRGKTGRVYGNLLTLLTVLKGLPLAYNKDLQEDKEALFDTVNTIKACLSVMSPLLESLKFNQEQMSRATRLGFLNATDLADFLVEKNIPFRECHEIVGKLVRYCVDHSKSLEDLSLQEFQEFSPAISEDVYIALDLRRSVDLRKVTGGPSSQATQVALEKAAHWLKSKLTGTHCC